MLHAQAFAPPVPAWPVGKEALLKALSEWVHAEADAVLFAVPGRGDKAVKLYVKLLKQWAGRLGGGQGWAIPRVGADLRVGKVGSPGPRSSREEEMQHTRRADGQ